MAMDEAGETKVRDVMTANVELIASDATVQEAALKMAEADIGALPVDENDRLVGMVTDRDIALRSAATGKNPARTKVREIMTRKVRYCFDDENADEAVESMSELQLRRLPVVNREKRLVGVVSLADIALRHDPGKAGAALEGVCLPGGAGANS
jgi:CBS domain-containing protein